MTHEEAIKVLRWALNRLDGWKYIIDSHGKVNPLAKVEAFSMAIEALKKQMPKKPINDWSESPFSDDKGCLFLHTMCPNCKKVEVNKMDSFCFNCGQAIDWSESE